MFERKRKPRGRRILDFLTVVLGAALLTAVCFGALTFLQAIGKQEVEERDGPEVEAIIAEEEPPQEEEPPDQKEEPPPPPELSDAPQPMDLSQLDALTSGLGSGFGSGGVVVQPGALLGGARGLESDFDVGAEEKAVPIYNPGPVLTPDLKKLGPVTVFVIFDVSPTGKIQRPKVLGSVHPKLVKATLSVVRKWKYNPAKKGGTPILSRHKVPIRFGGA